MFSFLTLLALFGLLAFPTAMLTITYPFSKKAALFWSNYITTHSARVFFAVLKKYRKFSLDMDEESKKNLPEKFIIISNHQSLMDIVVFFNFFDGLRVRFVAKDSLGKVPMVGKMLRSQGHCMIPRKGKNSVAMRHLDQFAERVNRFNYLPLIFPEGTRSRTGELGKFYAAGFRRISEKVNLPVVVCALDGGWQLADMKSIMRRLKKGCYHVKVLKVYDTPQNKEDEMKILEEAPGLIQQQLDLWRR